MNEYSNLSTYSNYFLLDLSLKLLQVAFNLRRFQKKVDMESLLAQVWEGLSRPFDQKFIPSAYFYDERGSQLFTQCENLPEYYLTRCEMSILRDPHTVQRMQTLLSLSNPSHLTLVDLGAGDGCKTLGFLKHWCSQAEEAGTAGSIKYIPIDFSSEACRQVADAFEHSN